MMASEPFVKMLKKLDRVLMSNDPTVIDAIKQAMVLTEVTDQHDPMYIYPVGPLESMYSRIENLSNKIDIMIQNSYRTATGTYYSTNTTGSYWSEPGYGAVGAVGSVDPLMSVLERNLNELKNTTPYFDNLVQPASPTEEGAFVLTDPDTGDSMSVKYK